MKKLPKNRRERLIAEKYLADGWEVLHKGWPDFLMFKDGKIKMIEVKRKPRDENDISLGSGLSAHQARVKIILSAHHDYSVEYLD